MEYSSRYLKHKLAFWFVGHIEAARVDTIKVTPARVERLRREAVVAPLSHAEAERIVAVAYGEPWARSGGWERGLGNKGRPPGWSWTS
jgi:hypothetical protein